MDNIQPRPIWIGQCANCDHVFWLVETADDAAYVRERFALFPDYGYALGNEVVTCADMPVFYTGQTGARCGQCLQPIPIPAAAEFLDPDRSPQS